MKTEWRPDDWVNPHKEFYERNPEVRPKVGDWDTEGIYESGASVMLSALIKWLDEPCNEHPLERKDVITGCYRYKEHRYLCPQCMAELKESGL
jgi:hypothetical protein